MRNRPQSYPLCIPSRHITSSCCQQMAHPSGYQPDLGDERPPTVNPADSGATRGPLSTSSTAPRTPVIHISNPPRPETRQDDEVDDQQGAPRDDVFDDELTDDAPATRRRQNELTLAVTSTADATPSLPLYQRRGSHIPSSRSSLTIPGMIPPGELRNPPSYLHRRGRPLRAGFTCFCSRVQRQIVQNIVRS